MNLPFESNITFSLVTFAGFVVLSYTFAISFSFLLGFSLGLGLLLYQSSIVGAWSMLGYLLAGILGIVPRLSINNNLFKSGGSPRV